MRTPSNDAAAVAKDTDGPDGPVRSCILTRDRASSASLVRLALAPDGRVLPDVRAKAPGRGAWIGVTRGELATAIAKGKLKGALARAFKTGDFQLPDDLPDLIETQLQRATLDRLGLEAKAGHLVTGFDRIDGTARGGQLHLLLHAADAGADGAGKLAQGWRVGTDSEGSGRKGLVLPVSRAILSQALGRENAVHIGVADAGAARRVSETLDRWLYFIGPEPGPEPCGIAPQGASAAATRAGSANEEM